MPKVKLPYITPNGSRTVFRKVGKFTTDELLEEISQLIESLGKGDIDDRQHDFLRAFLHQHYHPEISIRVRERSYQAIKSALEDEHLSQLRDIAGIRKRSAYINTISNVGKRSSYFGGLIGVTVAGHFFLPPIVKFGLLPMARHAVRKLAPRARHLIPFDKSLPISKICGKSPDRIYQGICHAIGSRLRRAGSTPSSRSIDTTAIDDMVGNLFFRALIEQSSFSEATKTDLRARAQVAFMHDMAHVSRQLEGLARNPSLTWERISYYTNFAMFLKSMQSAEVPIAEMLQASVDCISRASIGKKKQLKRFYAEYERGLRYLNYSLQVVEPLDRFNEQDVFDDMESLEAQLRFFEQNRLVMERLYLGHDPELIEPRNMFQAFTEAAQQAYPNKAQSEEQRYEVFQKRIKKILATHSKHLVILGKAELTSYDAEIARLG